MPLEPDLLAHALDRREALEAAQDEVERARGEFNRAVRHLSISGATMREIADALGLSHQRVHQLCEAGSPVPADDGARAAPSGGLLACSWCHRTQKQVAKLVAGPGCYICDDCIHGVRRVGDGRSEPDLGALIDADKPKCSFCGKSRRKLSWIAQAEIDHDQRICNECIELCEQILAEENRSD